MRRGASGEFRYGDTKANEMGHEEWQRLAVKFAIGLSNSNGVSFSLLVPLGDFFSQLSDFHQTVGGAH